MPESAKPLDPFGIPLKGVNLIEASAGTGKTWTITALYLRLILEGDMPVEQILAVTFTKAATAELKDRLRGCLARARRAFETGRAAEADSLVTGALDRTSDRAAGLRRIDRALRDFDQAAIHTIHGFCQRVLSEQPLESGAGFETEVLPDESLLLQEAADDFWRLRVADCEPILARYLVKKKCTPDLLLNGVRAYLAKPDLALPLASAGDLGAILTAYGAAREAARQKWFDGGKASGKTEMETFFLGAGLKRSSYALGTIPVWIAWLTEFLRAADAWLVPCDARGRKILEKFSAGCIEGALKNGCIMPRLAFPPLAEALAEAHDRLNSALDQWYRDLHVDLLRYLEKELPRKKERLRVLCYGDLLTRLRASLKDDRSLAGKVAEKYQAALIDEFQDTDPVQYDIFHRIFIGTGRPVFLVGDPKQAIYSFRGADIFTYLRARREAGEPLPLTVNRRSAKPLVDAVNILFGNRADAFVISDIPFLPSRAGDELPELLSDPDDRDAPFRVWFMEGDGDQLISRNDAARRAAEATAGEIVRLLDKGLRGEIAIKAGAASRSLRGNDIAVLVPTHRHGRMARQALAKLGVSCVQHSQDNVFESDEARDLELVLRALAEPGREDLVRAALATDLLGLDGGALYELSLNQEAWDRTLTEFRECHRLWSERGFMPMFRVLMRRREVAPRLLAFPDGERRLTNLNHLAELLHAASADVGRSPDGGVEWLALKRAEGALEEEAALLRLESDEHLVQIVTVHSSKGLQYPIVFCPFAWYVKDEAARKKQAVGVTYHDPKRKRREALDVSAEPPTDIVRQAAAEELAERLRFLYVSVTRARFRCHVVYGAVRGAGESALARLLGEFPGRQVLNGLSEDSGGALSVAALPEAKGERLQAVAETGLRYSSRPVLFAEVKPRWRVVSYSGLTAGAKLEMPPSAPQELPDHDQDAPEAPEPETGVRDGLPPGARIGTCLHSLFEALDFTDRDEEKLRELAGGILRGYGFGDDLTETVSCLVRRVLDTPLDRGGALRLRHIGGERRLNEMEFFYPVSGLEAGTLLGILRQHGLPEAFAACLDKVGMERVSGFMKGFIDLIFEAGGRYYLADYKSNLLAGYGEKRLEAEMAHALYFLQYLIYTVALHRYLGARLPGYDYDRHMGGVFYLFLRGMDPSRPGSGVFHDRPSRAQVEALDAYLRGNP